ncbi:MAG: hypothetical protein IMZ71_05715, partial [Chloroflexi bacterium]|nr:hypothetical protein [Chloroflexota bacterium]
VDMGEQGDVECVVDLALSSLPVEGLVRYLRFGDIPDKSHDYHSGQDEEGVSVYEAVERDGRIGVVLPTLNECACVSLSGVVRRPAYWVTGTVIGHGSDGEPLLADCRIVQSLGVIAEAVPASRKPAVEGLAERVAEDNPYLLHGDELGRAERAEHNR